MARSGRSGQRKSEPETPQPIVVDKRLAQRMVTYTQSPVPVRTVIFMEVGDLPPAQVRAAVETVRSLHGESLHPTFVVPVRVGKLTSDVIFESEILEMVNTICHVIDGKIALRDDAQDVDVMRTRL